MELQITFYYVWVELRKVRKAKKSEERELYISAWRVDSLKDKELREKYQEALELSEVDIFVEKLSSYRKSSTSNVENVRKALSEWKKVVSTVARDVISSC